MSAKLLLPDYELLSAYLDGQLSERDLSAVKRKLQAQTEWRLALEELEQTRQVLHRAPRYRAPRSFALTPEMATQAQRSFMSNLLGLRLSSALATLALVAIFVLEGAPLLTRQTAAPMLAAAPAAESMQQDSAVPAEEFAAPAEKSLVQPSSEATPMIITWGSPNENLDRYSMENAGNPAFGGGGSGGGADNSALPSVSPGGGIVTYDGEAPLNSFAPAAQPPLAEETTPLTENQAEAPPMVSPGMEMEGSGPILGVPEREQAGQILGSSALPDVNSTQDRQIQPQGLTKRRAVQLALLLVAVVGGSAAFSFARRRSA